MFLGYDKIPSGRGYFAIRQVMLQLSRFLFDCVNYANQILYPVKKKEFTFGIYTVAEQATNNKIKETPYSCVEKRSEVIAIGLSPEFFLAFISAANALINCLHCRYSSFASRSAKSLVNFKVCSDSISTNAVSGKFRISCMGQGKKNQKRSAKIMQRYN